MTGVKERSFQQKEKSWFSNQTVERCCPSSLEDSDSPFEKKEAAQTPAATCWEVISAGSKLESIIPLNKNLGIKVCQVIAWILWEGQGLGGPNFIKAALEELCCKKLPDGHTATGTMKPDLDQSLAIH